MKWKATGRIERRSPQWTAGVLALVAFAGCGQQPSNEAVAPRAEAATIADPAAAPAAEAPAPVAAAPSAPVALSEGMAYADLRKTVLANGWTPKVDAQCKANVVGGNFDQVCKDHPDQCKVCDDVPELSSCSGDGHCLMNFERGAGEALAVSTYGEIADWNVSGTSSRLSVKWWDPESIRHLPGSKPRNHRNKERVMSSPLADRGETLQSAQLALSQEWARIVSPNTGKSYYDKPGGAGGVEGKARLRPLFCNL